MAQINMSVRFIMTRSDAKWLQLGVLTGLGGGADQTIKCILHGCRKKKKKKSGRGEWSDGDTQRMAKKAD